MLPDVSIWLLLWWSSVELDEARAEVQTGLALNPGFTIRRYRAGAQSDNPLFLKRRERLIEDMRKAGVPEG